MDMYIYKKYNMYIHKEKQPKGGYNMTFSELRDTNSTLKTIPVKGNQYTPVSERIKAFRMMYPEGSIETEIVHFEDSKVIIKAIVKDPEGHTLATGHACEIEGSNNINRGSFVENCETSAIGRALGSIGIGIDTNVLSYEEKQSANNMNNRISRDEAAKLESELSDNQRKYIYDKFSIKALAELSQVQYDKVLKTLEARKTDKEIA